MGGRDFRLTHDLILGSASVWNLGLSSFYGVLKVGAVQMGAQPVPWNPPALPRYWRKQGADKADRSNPQQNAQMIPTRNERIKNR
jgi:hypothetical protein